MVVLLATARVLQIQHITDVNTSRPIAINNAPITLTSLGKTTNVKCTVSSTSRSIVAFDCNQNDGNNNVGKLVIVLKEYIVTQKIITKKAFHRNFTVIE